MKKTAELQTKYGTKKYDKLLEKMSDREYKQFKKLEDASPMWKTSTIKTASTRKKLLKILKKVLQ